MANQSLPALPNFGPVSSLPGYDIIGMLPPGPLGTPFRARHQDTGAEAELLFLHGPGEACADPTRTADWQQAVAVWSRTLNALQALGTHPQIPRVLLFGENETGFYVLLEAAEGVTLRQILEEEGARTVEWTLPLCVQIASALDFAAAQGVACGELTPEYIVFNTAGNRLRLHYFGLYCLHGNLVTAYTPPEQAAGQPGDARSDVYALGAVLYACLSGRPPFAAESREALCRQIQTTSPLPLLKQPAWVRDVLTRALQRVPTQRYRVAVDIATDLRLHRSPAPLPAADLAPSADSDCSLGRFMPEMALHEVAEPDTLSAVASKAKSTTKLHGFLARMRRPARNKEAASVKSLIRRDRNNPAGENPEAPLPASGAAEDGVPVRGLLGRFSRYMALQEYVFLAPDDLARRGWRGRLRRMGLLRSAPAGESAYPRRKARRLPVWLQNLFFKIAAVWRVLRVAVPLMFGVLSAHACWLVWQHQNAHVAARKGHPTVRVGGKTTLLFLGDSLNEAGQPVLSTEGGTELTLQLADSRVTLAPDSALKIRQLAFVQSRSRRLDLLHGQMKLEVQAQDGDEGRYEVWCHGVRVCADSARLIVTAQEGATQVRVSQGQARVFNGVSRRAVGEWQQLEARVGQPLPRPTALPLRARKTLLAAFPPAENHTLLTRGREAYLHAQQRTLMPLVARALNACHLLPGSSGNVLNAARTRTMARVSLESIAHALAATGEPPTKLNLHTLEETGLPRTDLNRLLSCFENHCLLGYHALPDGSCVLLARLNDESGTLLKAQGGAIAVVPEAEEEKTLGEEGEG